MAKAATAVRDTSGLGDRMKEFPARIKGFFSDVRNEMRKVTFPNIKEVRATTIVVIITVFVFALYFWLIDLVLNQALDKFVFHRLK
jgi:preprotein translocase subunit SecE